MIENKALSLLHSVMLFLAESFDHQHVVNSDFVEMSRWLCELAKCKDQHHIYEALRPCFVKFQSRTALQIPFRIGVIRGSHGYDSLCAEVGARESSL